MLKIAITLCLLAVSSGVKVAEIIDTASITITIETKTLYIQQMVSNMQRKLSTVTMDNFDVYLKTITVINYMQQIAKNYILNEMATKLNKARVDINDVRAQSRNAEYCFESGERDQQKIIASMNEELHKCAKHSIRLYVNGFSFPKDLRKYAERAMEKLARVIFLCLDNVPDQQKCFDSETEKTNVYVEDFEKRYTEGRRSRYKANRNAENYSLICIGKTIKNTKKKIDQWVFFTNSCVEGAE